MLPFENLWLIVKNISQGLFGSDPKNPCEIFLYAGLFQDTTLRLHKTKIAKWFDCVLRSPHLHIARN